MDEKREFHETQRARKNSGSINDERVGEPAQSLGTTDPGRAAKGEMIQAVSVLLSSKRAVLDRPLVPGSLSLPRIPSSFGEIVDRLKSPSIPRVNLDDTRTAHGLEVVNSPQGINADGIKAGEACSGEPSKVGTPVETNQATAVAPNVGSNSNRSGVPPTAPSVSRSTESAGMTSVGLNRRDGENLTDHRITASSSTAHPGPGSSPTAPTSDRERDVSHRISASISLDHAVQASPDAHAGSVSTLQTRPDPAIHFATGPDSSLTSGAKLPDSRSKAPIMPMAVSVAKPQASNGIGPLAESRHSISVERTGVGLSCPGLSVGQQANSPAHAEHSTNFVRNPLSADLRNYSMANPVPMESGTFLAGHGGSDRKPDEDLFGATSASHQGGSLDLSKTNELLQQLVDVVSKRSGSCLPIGGPSIYPDR